MYFKDDLFRRTVRCTGGQLKYCISKIIHPRDLRKKITKVVKKRPWKILSDFQNSPQGV